MVWWSETTSKHFEFAHHSMCRCTLVRLRGLVFRQSIPHTDVLKSGVTSRFEFAHHSKSRSRLVRWRRLPSSMPRWPASTLPPIGPSSSACSLGSSSSESKAWTNRVCQAFLSRPHLSVSTLGHTVVAIHATPQQQWHGIRPGAIPARRLCSRSASLRRRCTHLASELAVVCGDAPHRVPR